MTAALNRSLAAAVLTILTAAIGQAQVLPPRDTRPPSQQQPAVGTGLISGTVTMAGSTQPARKVRVSLSGAELRGGRTTVTDDRGAFSFTALPAGRYTLSANKPGHVSVTYGQRQPGRPGTPIQLSDGQKFRADLQIPKGSVITGTVLDEHGEPTPQVSVRVMRVVNRNGERTLQSSNGSSTDDRGIYRAYGLLPGEYVVCATPRNTTTTGTFERMRVELRALQASMEEVVRVNGEQAQTIANRITSIRSAMPDETDDVAPGYAPVCYPGTVSAAAATPITLGIAEERPGVDFQLQLAPLARVEGVLVNSTGANLRQVTVTLSNAAQDGLSIGNITARADSEGRFRLMNVPPGQYHLTARATITPPREPRAAGGARGRGAAPAAPRPEPVTVWGAVDITVDGRHLSNVMLSLQPGVPVSGQIAFEGATPPPSDLTRIRVTMSPVGPTRLGRSSSTRVDSSGRFTIPSVVPGSYRLSASNARGWTVESSVIGGQDALDFPIEVKGTQAVSGAVITFTDRQTELTGIVTDGKNQPAPEFTLVIFPADSRYWEGTSRRMQSTRPGTDGRYTFRNLPPGEYRLAPVYDLPPGAQTDPGFLQQLEATALRITLQPGEKKTQDMRVGTQ